MKKLKFLAGSAACAAVALSAIPFFASAAEDDLLYGTMNIPYADFYRAELANSSNAYEVDAVSSATTSKWNKNGEGELFEGTYNKANGDETGTILGVTYPVAISKTDLEALGNNKYGFTELDSVPAAYKTVTVTDGAASFSAVQDDSPEVIKGAEASISTETPWGDYIIDVTGTPENIGAIYGAILKTASGESYAMRHEQNIWRGEFAWSSGFKTEEPHGNTLDYENFVGLMGETVTEIVYITADGYIIVNTSLYVPVKCSGTLSVSDSSAGSDAASFTAEGFPDDYAKKYSVNGLNADINDGNISYTNALPGQYTFTISDEKGIYADVLASFVLSTDSMPAAYSDGKLAAANVSDDELANFIKNISTVSVNENEYSASGKGSVKIINDDGSIDLSAASRDADVFSGDGTYKLSVKATGYDNSLEFEFTVRNGKIISEADNAVSDSSTSSPKTGTTGVAVPLGIMALGAVTAFVSRKKK